MSKLTTVLATTVLLALPFTAHALTYQFNASLNGENGVPPTGASGTGLATLSYDDNNSMVTTDDSYSLSLSAFGLSGPSTGMHIHAPADESTNAPVVVNFVAPDFLVLSSGTSLLVGGADVSPPYPGFLTQLQAGLTYAQVHTALNPTGEIRGQFLQVTQVTAVPEPSSYAMLVAGLGLVGFVVRRKSQTLNAVTSA